MSGELETDCEFSHRIFAESNANTTGRHPSNDKLYNPEAILPQRPTITNVQWISGTQYISPADMDILSMLSFPLQTQSLRVLVSNVKCSWRSRPTSIQADG